MSVHSAPRDPASLRPSLHFRERFEEPERHLDGDIVETCIRDGDVEPDGSVLRYRATIAGVTYRLVVNPEKGAVVSGYPTGINTEVAKASGRWSTADVEDIRAFLARDD